ncbi:MAG: tRNA uridine-5-carboxymethylaminomethyl(34) synthesis GTPase MnmE [Crocinitomicaceae bacterium]|nr:tRNA uridine-5-carboxymethylaminomethyl(34) synthesis GTPase MnmE [Crocinitomicaceae bacterium]MDG1775783.1 tRNA uridine-5-carboxymethylaminomethyl(34) synthesis GTPase MnmE [Crocinitomicaceae bacterium]
MFQNQNTICALATANGVGAIGVIRLSGSKSYEVVSKSFSKNLVGLSSHTTHFGTISSKEGILIDEVLVAIFENGKSFTGEESVEISCHGSVYIQQKILAILIENGCRMANPGEFTQRAFLNGKMDLSQAEAVADLIASESKSAHDIALKQLRGKFSSELKELREKLINFASLVELELDFAEEDVEFADRTELKSLVSNVLIYIKRLAKSFELGNAIKNGVPVAIVGAPNTGKSTLLNQLLGDDRAIVSNIEGTTRDVIEETLNIEGILFRLIDTAGIREGAEEVEAMGIERSLEKIKQATIVLCIADATKPDNIKEVSSWTQELEVSHPDKKIVMVLNKTDVVPSQVEEAIHISAKQGSNIEQLKDRLVSEVQGDFNLGNETIVSNARHYEALVQTAESLQKAEEGLATEVTADFVAMDIRQAMFHLGSITGDISTDDLLGNIFSKFCIGK